TKVPALAANAEQVNGNRVVVTNLGVLANVDDLRSLTIQVRDQFGSNAGVAVLFAEINDKPMVVAAVNKQAQDAGLKAGQLVRTASAILGGGGGGKDDIAQGGGQDVASIDKAIAAVKESI
ncbi:MAG: alanine--tRNA ligase, partial [Actinomycetota bacterium]